MNATLGAPPSLKTQKVSPMSKWFHTLALCLCLLGAHGCGDLGEEDEASGFSAQERQMLQEVNSVRARGIACGEKMMPAVGPLKLVASLNRAAKAHSLDMAKQNYFDHTSKDGASPSERAKRAGYVGRGVGENIAAGRATVSEVMAQWLGSPGHCTNIMRAGYTDFGMGHAQQTGSAYGHYWTQLFGG